MPAGDVGQAHSRVGFVDVLTTRARSTEGVGTHVRRVDIDFDGVIDFGVNKHGRERGVTATRRVERRLANQAVHTGFGAQKAKGIFAFHLDGGALDAGDVARGFVFHLGFEALALAVTHVLAQQHGGPVAGLGATGSGLDVNKAVQRVGFIC